MREKIGVLVVDRGQRLRQDLTVHLEKKGLYPVGWVREWDQLVQQIEHPAFQWILCDYQMGNLKSYALLLQLRNLLLDRNVRTNVFAAGSVNEYMDPRVLQNLSAQGFVPGFIQSHESDQIVHELRCTMENTKSPEGEAFYTFPKNFEASHREISDNPLAEAVEQHLKALRFSSSEKGYTYLRQALVAILGNPELLQQVTKVLYPLLAREHQVNLCCVERNIRYSLLRAYENCPQDIWNRYLGWEGTKKAGTAPLSNKNFLRLMYEYFMDDRNQEVKC